MKNKQFRSRNNRGGRGSNKSNTSKNSTAKSSKPDKTKGLESHIYNIGKSEHCVEVTDYIMNHIRQEYDQGNDIATAIEKGEEKTFSSLMPIMRSVIKPDELKEQASEIEKESYKIRMGDYEARKRSYELVHKEEVTQFVRRKQTYEQNKVKAYSLLLQQCSEKLTSEIKAREDYDVESSERIKDDPVKLLKVIKEEVHNFRETKHDMVIVTQAAKQLLNVKQGPNESLLEHTARFKDLCDIMKSKCGGYITLQAVWEKHPEHVLCEGEPSKAAEIRRKLAPG